MTAVLFDLKDGKIPNGVIAAGLMWGCSYQLVVHGGMGMIFFLGGSCFPILLFGALYYFRMIGAGDIKLFCVTGGFLGPYGCFYCAVTAIFTGGIISLAIMLRRHIISQRLLYFSEYISDYSRNRKWKPYRNRASTESQFCFSVPVLLGVLCHIGGIF